MEQAINKKKRNIFTALFKSLIDDIKNSIKSHYLKIIGLIISTVIPIATVVVTYIQEKPKSWGLPMFVWIPLIVMLFVYWGKARSFFASKVATMQVENNIQRGKHAGAIVLLKTFQGVMTVAPFLLCYFIFHELSKIAIKIEDIFLYFTICEGLGYIFIIADTIKNVTLDEEQVNE